MGNIKKKIQENIKWQVNDEVHKKSKEKKKQKDDVSVWKLMSLISTNSERKT